MCDRLLWIQGKWIKPAFINGGLTLLFTPEILRLCFTPQPDADYFLLDRHAYAGKICRPCRSGYIQYQYRACHDADFSFYSARIRIHAYSRRNVYKKAAG